MGRSPISNHGQGLRKGAWTTDEDHKLLSYVKQHGEGAWRSLPQKAGLLRCGKSCRLRWANYLRPGIRRGNFSPEEDQTIIRLHAVLGSRWSTIARHLYKRTDNEIKNYWNTRLKRRAMEIMNCTTSSSSSMETMECHPVVSENNNINNDKNPIINIINPSATSNDTLSTRANTTTTTTSSDPLNDDDHQQTPPNNIVQNFCQTIIDNAKNYFNSLVISETCVSSSSTTSSHNVTKGALSSPSTSASTLAHDHQLINNNNNNNDGISTNDHDHPVSRPASSAALTRHGLLLNKIASKLALIDLPSIIGGCGGSGDGDGDCDGGFLRDSFSDSGLLPSNDGAATGVPQQSAGFSAFICEGVDKLLMCRQGVEMLDPFEELIVETPADNYNNAMDDASRDNNNNNNNKKSSGVIDDHNDNININININDCSLEQEMWKHFSEDFDQLIGFSTSDEDIYSK